MFLYLAMIDSERRQVQVRDSLQRIQKSDVLHRKPHSAQQQRCGGRGASGFSQSHRNSGYHFFTKVSQNACAARHYYRAQSNRPVPRKASAAMSCRLPRNISEPRLPPRSSVSPSATHCRRLSRPCRRVTARSCSCGTTAAIPTRRLQYSGYDRAERAQAHPACQGKTQRSAERMEEP